MKIKLQPEIKVHENDLPVETFQSDKAIAIDTETMGLNINRDRLCLVQLSAGDGVCHLVKIKKGAKPEHSPNLIKLLKDPSVLKVFHYARFDVAVLMNHLKIEIPSIYCTKIASKLVRTYTDKHGLKDLCAEIIKQDISKQQQTTDWGFSELTEAQLKYAATDVLFLLEIKNKLDEMLEREQRTELAKACFDFLPEKCKLDLLCGENFDIFLH